MRPTINGTVNWRWLGPTVFLIAIALGAYIVNGIDLDVSDHETRIQNLSISVVVQQEILVRIETKLDELIAKKEK